MAVEVDVYRQLQKHLDRMPIGLPSTKSGVELKLLEFMFTPEQAEIALLVDYRHRSLDEIYEAAGDLSISKEELQRILDETVSRGGITCSAPGRLTAADIFGIPVVMAAVPSTAV